MTASNKLQYDSITCVPIKFKSIQVRFRNVIGTVEIIHKKTGQSYFSKLIYKIVNSDSGMVDISKYLTDGDKDEIKIR